MRDFRKYEIWQKGVDIADKVYDLCDKLPKYEQYALCDQLRRAAVSISSNIAEGSSRTSEAEFAHFLEYSIGSCFEVETQLEVAKRRRYINDDQFYDLQIALHVEEKQINQFISQLKNRR